MGVLTRISEHVYWMPPGPPDRPSVCAVVGDRRTLMLDAGSSKAHTRAFLESLLAECAALPCAVVYTHAHWDHVFGGAELGGLVIAQAFTAEQLIELAARDWSDEGLDRLVATGQASAQHAENVKQEMPSPRTVALAPADIVFQDALDFELGGVAVCVRHVGGDHSSDSSVMYVEPDRVLFLGDCLYDSPAGALTAELAFPLYGTILGFDADLYVEGTVPRSCLVGTSRFFTRRCDWRRRQSAKGRQGSAGQSTWSTALPPMRRFRSASSARAGSRHEPSSSIWPSSRPSSISVQRRVRSPAPPPWNVRSSRRSRV
jgi:glyoxylase-like metal-dependent hydrolase (beta-lactamase superfamily II)